MIFILEEGKALSVVGGGYRGDRRIYRRDDASW